MFSKQITSHWTNHWQSISVFHHVRDVEGHVTQQNYDYYQGANGPKSGTELILALESELYLPSEDVDVKALIHDNIVLFYLLPQRPFEGLVHHRVSSLHVDYFRIFKISNFF